MDPDTQALPFNGSLPPLSVPWSSIFFIHFKEKVAFAYDGKGQKQMVYGSLNQLEAVLPPGLFFRVNRAFLVHRQAIAAFFPVKNAGRDSASPSLCGSSRHRQPEKDAGL